MVKQARKFENPVTDMPEMTTKQRKKIGT